MNFRNQKPVARRLSPLAQGRVPLMLCGFLVTIVASLLLFYPPELLRFFDFRIFDLLSGRQVRSVEQKPVVVGIDEESLARFGQWPWPRYRLAQLVEILGQQGATVIGIDLLLPEEDRTSPDVIFRERQRDLQEGLVDVNWLRGLQQNDQLLSDALAAAPSLLGYKFLSVPNPAGRDWAPAPFAGLAVRSEQNLESLWDEPQGVLPSLDMLMGAAGQAGFTNAVADRDGVIRRVPLMLNYRGQYCPSLALAAVLGHLQVRQLLLSLSRHEASLAWEGQEVPLDRRGNLLLGYLGESAYRYVSAADLLQGEVADGSLSGALVFVGVVAEGLGDRHVTPRERDFPGVKIHAVVASNLLNQSWYSHPLWARGLELLGVIVLGLFSTWLFSFYHLRLPLLLSLGAVGAVSWGTLELFRGWSYFVSPTMPILVLLMNASLLGLMRYGVATRNLHHRNRDLLKAQDATIVSLITLAETRDTDTGTHILRTQRFVKVLAEQLRRDSAYSADISAEDVEMLFQSAPLHDIGKVGIPDKILLKQGMLSEEEFAVMRQHPRLGARALSRTAEVLEDPGGYAFLHFARQMAETHHERWDGSGYPAGLQGEAIPLAGRLMAVADVYDALISDRAYKETSSHDQAREYVVSKSGQLFDPEIVKAFLACEEAFAAITKAYRDEFGHDS